MRRVTNETAENETDRPEVMLSPERLAFLGAAEDFILTITENGIGKRTSAYEYRITNRGGQGIWNIDVTDRAGSVVAGFPVNHSDQIMLVTNSGQLIRCAVDEIGITGRRTQGVWIFRVDNDERVVSVSLIGDEVNSSDEQDNIEGQSEL